MTTEIRHYPHLTPDQIGELLEDEPLPCACQRDRDDEADRKLRAAMMVIRQGCLLIAKGIEREFLDDQRKDKAV